MFIFATAGWLYPSSQSINAVIAAAATAGLLRSPTPLSPQKKNELGQVVQQQHAAGDEWNAADDNAGGFDAGGRSCARRRKARDDHRNLRDGHMVQQEELRAGAYRG